MTKILIVIGTRPNFVKVTQFKQAAASFKELEFTIAHTGQHYDKNMSKVFFEQFGLQPDHFLNVKASSAAGIVGETMIKIDELIKEIKPSMLLAVGDVNSTLAASIAANKNNVLLGHIESGLRSFDRSMPEEINRILTDEIADHLFITEQSGIDNLIREGKKRKSMHFVGNTMIDTLISFEDQINKCKILEDNALAPQSYFLLTMHRPSNVDSKEQCEKMLSLIVLLLKYKRVVFPIHPRTQKSLKKFNLWEELEEIEQVNLLEPLDYFAFQKLVKEAELVVTDSGGIQEETTFRKVPCITLRDNTERPSTTDIGTNYLIGFDLFKIENILEEGYRKRSKIPELWDGKATNRIIEKIAEILD